MSKAKPYECFFKLTIIAYEIFTIFCRKLRQDSPYAIIKKMKKLEKGVER